MSARIGRLLVIVVAAGLAGCPAAGPNSHSLTAPHAAPGPSVAAPPGAFEPFVDMATFMDHVLTPAATVVWRTNGFVSDASGDHDLAPRTDADWELVVSGAATLAEATNALLIPQRVRDAEWPGYVRPLAVAAKRAYEAAEKKDLATLADVSDHLDAICSSCHRHYGAE